MYQFIFLTGLLLLQVAGGKTQNPDADRQDDVIEMKKILARQEKQIQQLTQTMSEYKEQLTEYSIIQDSQEKQINEYKERQKEYRRIQENQGRLLDDYKTTQELQGKQLHKCRITQINQARQLIGLQQIIFNRKNKTSKAKRMKNPGTNIYSHSK